MRSLIILTAGATLFFAEVLNAQETHTVTLIVDTANFDRNNPASSCALRSESPNTGVVESNGDLENFTVTMQEGDLVVWEGISSSNPEDLVHLKKIKYEKGTKIFNKDRLDGKPQSGKGDIVEGKTISNTKNKEDFKYTMLFKVDSQNGTFKIDPKIKVGQ